MHFRSKNIDEKSMYLITERYTPDIANMNTEKNGIQMNFIEFIKLRLENSKSVIKPANNIELKIKKKSNIKTIVFLWDRSIDKSLSRIIYLFNPISFLLIYMLCLPKDNIPPPT